MDGNCGHSTFSEEFVCKTEKAFICKPKSDLDSDICNVTTHSKYSTSDLPALKGCEMKLEFEGEHLEPKYSSYDNILTNIKSEPTDLPEIIDIPQLVGQLADQKTPVVPGIKQEIFPTIIKVEIEKSNFDEKINQEDIGFNEGFKLEHEEVNLTDVKNKVDLDEGPSFSDENPKFSTTENNFRCNNLGSKIVITEDPHSNSQLLLWLNCNICGKKFQQKRYITRHIKNMHPETLHNKNVEIDKLYHSKFLTQKHFKCDQCSFKSTYKQNLKTHYKIHRNPDLKIYKCDSCDYDTPFKHYLRSHQLIHKSDAEVTMFKCNFCPYKSKYKSSINGHKKFHTRLAERLKNPYMYKCAQCSFRTRHDKILANHIKLHDDFNKNVVLFKCEFCDYITDRKKSLRRHSLIHKAQSEVKMFNCSQCNYKSNKKGCLLRHISAHKKNCPIYMCNECDFQSLNKGRLTIHSLTHLNQVEHP